MKIKSNSKKILFLFTELSGYILNCFNYAIQDGYEIHVVIYPINKEAPFEFCKEASLKIYPREDFLNETTLIDLINHIKPNLIFVSGWIDKIYLKSINKLSFSKIIMLLDTPWKSNFKQHIWKIFFSYKYFKLFDAIWVPGQIQKLYAKKLGFLDKDIYDGLYTCDNNLFKSYYKYSLKDKESIYPKRLLFVGRYIDKKGIVELWDNFVEIVEEYSLEWELWCVGTGDLWSQRKLHPLIKHFGFLQPDELAEVIKCTGVYILPSKYEPWGVSLHEMVSAGMPVLVSKDVGSRGCFIEDEVNGLVFSHKIKNDFKDKLLKMTQYSSSELLNMGKESVHLSNKFSTTTWMETLNKIHD